jgi:transposase
LIKGGNVKMYRVKIKESADDIQFIKDCGLSTSTIYTTYRKDNGTYEISGFEFEKDELEFLD